MARRACLQNAVQHDGQCQPKGLMGRIMGAHPEFRDDPGAVMKALMAAGADVIKTSTGKISPAATRPVTLIMLEAVRDFARLTGLERGVKAAGGIRSTKDAIRYLVLVHEIAGSAWLTPDRFRFGASSLLDDLLMQRIKQRTGRYHSMNYVPIA